MKDIIYTECLDAGPKYNILEWGESALEEAEVCWVAVSSSQFKLPNSEKILFQSSVLTILHK